MGKLVFQVTGAFAEFERTMIRQRVKAGLKRAVAQGVKLGRPKIDSVTERKVRKQLAKGMGILKVAKSLGIGTGTVQRSNRHRTRHLLNQEFMQALLLNFRHEGKKAIEKVARNQPAVYLKILALLVPREMKVEHSQGIKAMTDEQLEAAVEALQAMIDGKLSGESAKVIESVAEPVALPAPSRKPRRKRGAEAKASPLLPDEQGESE
jgi:hypothetical protein